MIRTLPTSMQRNTPNLLSTSMHDGRVWFILRLQAYNSILPIFQVGDGPTIDHHSGEGELTTRHNWGR